MNFTAAKERKGKQTFLSPSPLYYERRIAEEYYYYYDYYYGCRRERETLFHSLPLLLLRGNASLLPPPTSPSPGGGGGCCIFGEGGKWGALLSLSLSSLSPCTVCPTVVGSGSSSSSMVVGVCCTADPGSSGVEEGL